MVRIVSALLIVIAAAAIATVVPGIQALVILIGGSIAVLVAALGSQRAERASVRPVAAGTALSPEAIIAAIAEPLLLVVDGRVRIANPAASALLGAHIVGEDIRLAIRHPAAAERLGVGGTDGSTELIGLGGRDQRVQMQVATLRPGQRLIHLIDRTVNYAAERARVDFVANSSHELRTPLAAIIGFIETLDDENVGADAGVRERFLSVMMKEARRMQRLIDDLISLSRIEAEKHSLPETPVDLRQLIEEVAGELRDEAGEMRSDLVLDVGETLPPVTGDRAQLSQVIHNLAGNAIKYGRTGAPVTIGLRSEANALIRLSVTDCGEGIGASHIPRLTERFYRVDPGRSRAMGGTGLGLAIVKHIVERHRGRLEIASTIGVGTTFSVLLPSAPRPTVTEVSPR